MTPLKKRADIIIFNAHILTMDASWKQFEKGAIAICGSVIEALGEESFILEQYESSHKVDARKKILMPGLINGHCHLPMSLLRGLADDLRLDVWLMGYIMPVERTFVSQDFVKLGTRLACAELIRSGVTTVADMYYFEEAIAETVSSIGIRALLGETILKFPSPDASSFEDSMNMCRNFVEKWKNHETITPCFAPHAPYTCTEEILQQVAKFAKEANVPVQMHLAETENEVNTLRQDKGMPVIPWVKKQGLLETKLIAAHCVHIDKGEMRTLQNAGAGVVHNPSSNLKLGSGIAPLKEMLDQGLQVCIGTDGAASNNDLDMFEEIRLAAFLAKGSGKDPTAVSAKEALLCATRMGAHAMHLGNDIGSLEVGKKADLMLLDLNKSHIYPRFQRDPDLIYSQIVYSAKSTDVVDVMVHGKWLMQDQKLLTLNESELAEQAQAFAKKVDVFLRERERSVLTKLIAIGGASEAESFEAQVKVKLDDFEICKEQIEAQKFFRILRKRHYKEYDTYMIFKDEPDLYLRYREDEFLNEREEVSQVRYRLTLVGAQHEVASQNGLVSQSRFIAPAAHSLRFYREYFAPSQEKNIEKLRLRWLIEYQGTEFYINLDTIKLPSLGVFLEIKSRTWSRKDAEDKTQKMIELLKLLGWHQNPILKEDYFHMSLSL